MTENEKLRIREQILSYIKQAGSQKRAAEMLGIAAATIHALVHGEWDKLSDEMLRKLDAKTTRSKDWTVVETGVFREISQVLTEAKADAMVTWIVSPAGSGKSTAARHYAQTEPGCIYVLCSEDMYRKDFLHALARSAGFSLPPSNLRQTLHELVDRLLGMDHPLLIFDEADKLSDNVIHYFIQLYNLLEDHAGIVYLSTNYIERRMSRGLAYNKRGYAEMSSRLGRKFYRLYPVAETDVYGICAGNGITDEAMIGEIVADAAGYEYDLRRVKKLVQARR